MKSSIERLKASYLSVLNVNDFIKIMFLDFEVFKISIAFWVV
jgi:hypothetical protein